MRATPRAGRSGLAGVRDGALVVRLAAAPVEGAANDELIRVLAAALDVPRRALRIVSGDRSRDKRIDIEGLSPARVLSRLQARLERL